MEYAQQQAVNVAARPPRPMERVAEAADRINAINSHLADTIGRFSGNPAGLSKGSDAPISISYLDQIGRLHGGIDLLAKLTEELGELA